MASSHEWIEHTGELELSVSADTREAAFVEAAGALGELLAEHERDASGEAGAGAEGAPDRGPQSFEVSASAPDDATLLAEWLSELLYHAESQDRVPTRVERIELSDTVLEATVSARTGTPSHLVKAVTYHRLELCRSSGGWRARVVLDV